MLYRPCENIKIWRTQGTGHSELVFFETIVIKIVGLIELQNFFWLWGYELSGKIIYALGVICGCNSKQNF